LLLAVPSGLGFGGKTAAALLLAFLGFDLDNGSVLETAPAEVCLLVAVPFGFGFSIETAPPFFLALLRSQLNNGPVFETAPAEFGFLAVLKRVLGLALVFGLPRN
jgi:hypothetical protein